MRCRVRVRAVGLVKWGLVVIDPNPNPRSNPNRVRDIGTGQCQLVVTNMNSVVSSEVTTESRCLHT